MEFAAATQRARLEYERDVTLAWAIEFMARQKTLNAESRKKLLERGKTVRQTPAELHAYMQQLSATLGVPLLRVALR